MGITVTGLGGITDWLNEGVVKDCNLMIKNIVEDATTNTPVGETGFLKESWVTTELQTVADIGVVENTAPYSGYVENGTDKMQARLMLNNAVDREMNKT